MALALNTRAIGSAVPSPRLMSRTAASQPERSISARACATEPTGPTTVTPASDKIQKTIEKLIAQAGQPSFAVIVVTLVAIWIAINLGLSALGRKPIDEPPFFWLQGVVALAALLMTSLILTTQRRENEIATHREQLTLQLCILSEQKCAKIIQLLEELRHDSPDLRNRVDREASSTN